MPASEVSIALVYPDLLGTYGDGGNALILASRLSWRGIPARLVTVEAGQPTPETCDLYLLGGGEDAPQALAAAELRRGGLRRAVENNAAVLAVCAGLQVLGTRFRAGGTTVEGVGLVDADSTVALPTRAVGELAVDPASGPRLSGYENHASATTRGAGVEPFGRVASGVGNGDGTDGYRCGRILGTYLHGPLLARNPEVADLLLELVVGDLPPLTRPDVDADARALRQERLTTLGRTRRGPSLRSLRSRWTRRRRLAPR